MELIALSGYARSGKDEAAKVLVEEFGFTRVAFADKLREALYQLNPIVSVLFATPERGDPYEWVHVQDVIDDYGWDGCKETKFGPEIRRLLQRLGTEAGRKTLWDSIWIDAAFVGYENSSSKIVVTDCRFPNEASAIKERGGQVWRVNRKGVGPLKDTDGSVHQSEVSLEDWNFDLVLQNDNDLQGWHNKVRWAGSIAPFVKM